MLKSGPWKVFKKGIYIYIFNELHPVANLREVLTRREGGGIRSGFRDCHGKTNSRKTIVVPKVKERLGIL
jgi:hypothetical protein